MQVTEHFVQVVESLGIEGNEYGILPYARHVWVSTQGHIKVAWKNQVLPPGSEFPQFPSFAHDVALSLKNAVLVDQVLCRLSRQFLTCINFRWYIGIKMVGI